MENVMAAAAMSSTMTMAMANEDDDNGATTLYRLAGRPHSTAATAACCMCFSNSFIIGI